MTRKDFRRPLEISDWKLFCKHTHRVKIFKDQRVYSKYTGIGILGFQRYQLSTDALKAITSWALRQDGNPLREAPSNLFPQLRTLIVHTEFEGLWVPSYFPYFYRGGALQRLALNWREDMPGPDLDSPADTDLYTRLTDVSSSLCSAWPHLRYIELTTHTTAHAREMELYLESMTTWIKNLTCLQSFGATSSLLPSLIYTLSELPLLHTVNLEGDMDCTSPGSDFAQLSPSCFSSLRALRVTSYEPNSPTPFLHGLRHCSQLTDIRISYSYTRNSPDSLEQVATLFEMVSRIPTTETLHISLGKRPHSHNWPDPSEPVLSIQLFRILFSLRRMQDISLMGFYDISLNDSDLEVIAAAWPRLLAICLSTICPESPYTEEHPPWITMVGIQALYNGCPDLESVDLAVNERLPIDNFVLTLPAARPRGVAIYLRLHFCPETIGEGGCFEHGSSTYIPMVVRLMFPQLEYFEACTVHDCFMCWEDDTSTYWQKYRDVDVSQVLKLLTALADRTSTEAKHRMHRQWPFDSVVAQIWNEDNVSESELVQCK